jgi:hypothetical protein
MTTSSSVIVTRSRTDLARRSIPSMPLVACRRSWITSQPRWPMKSPPVAWTPVRSPRPPPLAEEPGPGRPELDVHDLLSRYCTIDQVVHTYGDVCQAVIDHALDHHITMTHDDFRMLYCALDRLIAEAVSEFSRRRDVVMALKAAKATNEKLGSLAHEMRNHIHRADLALRILKSGRVMATAAPDAVLDRCMAAMKDLVERSLEDVKGAVYRLIEPAFRCPGSSMKSLRRFPACFRMLSILRKPVRRLQCLYAPWRTAYSYRSRIIAAVFRTMRNPGSRPSYRVLRIAVGSGWASRYPGRTSRPIWEH